MYTTILITTCCILILLPGPAIATHLYPPVSSAPSTALPIQYSTLINQDQDQVIFKPWLKGNYDHPHRVYHKREVVNCKPKGVHHSSAPSRFVNYHVLACSPAETALNP